jgi:hypothetical protein
MAAKKDIAALEKLARKQDWTVEPTRGGHLRWTPAGGGQPYFSSKTPSDSKAISNIKSDLRKRGLVLPS